MGLLKDGQMSDQWGMGLRGEVKGKDGKPPDKWDFIQAVANAPVVFNNYSGSCAGSGSGDFHMYRNWRRKEFSRLSQMDRDAKKERIEKNFQEKVESVKKEHEEQVNKKQSKRKAKKAREKENKRKKIEAGKASNGGENGAEEKAQSDAEEDKEEDEEE